MKNFERISHEFPPHGAAIVKSSANIVTGAYTLSDVITLQIELRYMADGFSLRKWAVNYHKIFAGIPSEHCLIRKVMSHWYSVEDVRSPSKSMPVLSRNIPTDAFLRKQNDSLICLDDCSNPNKSSYSVSLTAMTGAFDN